MSGSDSARVTTFVGVSPEDAFAVFTEQIDRWWRRGPRFRGGDSGGSELCFERDAAGRRLVERSEGDVFEIGRVRVWEPGRRLVFEWRGRNFAPDESTEVELRFEPAGEGTRVTLEHRGWEAIRGDHPARHGLRGEAFTSMIGLHWGELATAYRVHVKNARGS
jgi:uncharacterized protein YndB with AHSA1/START domain